LDRCYDMRRVNDVALGTTQRAPARRALHQLQTERTNEEQTLDLAM